MDCKDCEWIKILCSITFVGYDNNVETIESFMAGKECKSYAKVKPNLRTRIWQWLKDLNRNENLMFVVLAVVLLITFIFIVGL